MKGGYAQSSVPLVAMMASRFWSMSAPCARRPLGAGLISPWVDAYFFFMKNMYSPLASAEDSSSFPVCLAKACMSFTEPGSVAMILSTWPDCISASDFLVRRIGSGQFRPRASSSLSKFISLLLSNCGARLGPPLPPFMEPLKNPLGGRGERHARPHPAEDSPIQIVNIRPRRAGRDEGAGLGGPGAGPAIEHRGNAVAH